MNTDAMEGEIENIFLKDETIYKETGKTSQLKIQKSITRLSLDDKSEDEYRYHFKYQMEVTLAKSNRRKRPRFASGKIEVFGDDLSIADTIAFRTFLGQDVPGKYHSEAEGIMLNGTQKILWQIQLPEI